MRFNKNDRSYYCRLSQKFLQILQRYDGLAGSGVLPQYPISHKPIISSFKANSQSLLGRARTQQQHPAMNTKALTNQLGAPHLLWTMIVATKFRKNPGEWDSNPAHPQLNLGPSPLPHSASLGNRSNSKRRYSHVLMITPILWTLKLNRDSLHKF